LISNLSKNPSISILDRKDLETFLNLNDLQQNDQLDNVVNIGSRLGLDFIVVGSVAKRGSAITVKCGLVQIDKRKEVYSTQVRAQGESALSAEIAKLASLLSSVLTKSGAVGPESASTPGTGSGPGAGAPVNFTGVPGNKKIILRWQPVPGFATAGYEVYRALNANGPFAMLGQTDKTEYADQNVENDISYFYRIRAYDRLSRLSDYTPVVSARTDFAPNPPIILKTEGRAKSISIFWTLNPSKSLDTSRLAGYKIYRAVEENGTYQEVGKQMLAELPENSDGKNVHRVTGLPDGQTYFYCMAVFNAKGVESELSHPIKGTTLPVVASVKATGSLIREVKLTWTGISSPLLAAYNIYRSTKSDGGFVKIKRINAAEGDSRYEYSDMEGLGDNTPYYYTVTAEDDLKAETSPSAAVSATTRDIPPRPEKFAARGDLVKKVELTWQAAPQPEVEGYYIFWSTEKTGKYELLKKIPGRENNRYMDESRGFNALEDGTAYYYMLTAYNKVDAQSKQAQASATTKPRPKKPAGLKGTSSRVKEAPLAWQANPEKDIRVYLIHRAAGDSDSFSGIGEAGATLYTDANLKDGTTYRYRIQAKDADNLLSDLSETVGVTTKPRPQPPENLQGKYQSGKAVLSWTPSKEADISHYVIYEKKFIGAEKISESKTASYSDGSLAPGKDRNYVVSAVDKTGLESDVSAELKVIAK
jgi:fibronectin type 3 domain-containing protein